MPRLSEMTQEICDLICDGIADGQSLRSICAAEAMPNKSTVFRWLAADEAFRDQYARAREAQADALFDDILDIADDGTNDYMTKTNADGSEYEAFNAEHIQRSKLRVDARKWMRQGARAEIERIIGTIERPCRIATTHQRRE
jgi:hypothetical protein